MKKLSVLRVSSKREIEKVLYSWGFEQDSLDEGDDAWYNGSLQVNVGNNNLLISRETKSGGNYKIIRRDKVQKLNLDELESWFKELDFDALI